MIIQNVICDFCGKEIDTSMNHSEFNHIRIEYPQGHINTDICRECGHFIDKNNLLNIMLADIIVACKNNSIEGSSKGEK